ncbi:hypothetical protein KKC06_03630 [Patescibacteria group bacterium]|nr:hypothetical protein [Patescibacteria group bacterium]
MDYIIVFILGILATFVSQWLWHKYQKKEDKKIILPSVAVSKLERDETIYVEIINNGSEDIKDFNVNIKWKQDHQPQERKLENFFKPEDDPLVDSSENIEFLRKDEKIRGSDIPQRSDDNIIKIIVKGSGGTSDNPLKMVTEIKLKPRAGMWFE